MNNTNIYLLIAIALSILIAMLGVLLNTWIAMRRKIHRETKELITKVLPQIPGGYGQLKIIEDYPYQVWILEQSKTVIGRAPYVDIQLDSFMVSRRHAIIERRDNKFYISDCHSINGTIVNGIKISGVLELHKDDIIIIGQIKLLFSRVEVGRN